MVRATVTFALLFFAYVNAAPAPRVIEFTWLRNSGPNFDLGAGDNEKAKEVLDLARYLAFLNLPKSVANSIPKVSFTENVNSEDVVLDVHVDTDKILSVGRSIKDKVLPVLKESVKEFLLALKLR